MSAWFTAIKAVLPHIGSIVSAAAPVFTRRAEPAPQSQVLQQQIAELQNASAQNAAYIKDLAAQITSAIAALEQAAVVHERRLRRAYIVAIAALGIAVMALVLVVIGVN